MFVLQYSVGKMDLGYPKQDLLTVFTLKPHIPRRTPAAKRFAVLTVRTGGVVEARVTRTRKTVRDMAGNSLFIHVFFLFSI